MAETLIKIDLSKSAYENENIHNRWHPDIPMAATVKPGDDFILECYDWTGGQIKNDDSADDVRDVDLTQVHFLSGPVGVEGAEPGDLLEVDILDIGAFKDRPLWGPAGDPDVVAPAVVTSLDPVSVAAPGQPCDLHPLDLFL